MRHRPSSFALAGTQVPDPVLVRLLWQWLVLALLVTPWLPVELAGRIGSPWLWAVAAPLSGLLVLHRDGLAAAGRRLLAPAPVAAGHPLPAAFSRPLPADRTPKPTPVQARRMRRRPTAEPGQARAA